MNFSEEPQAPKNIIPVIIVAGIRSQEDLESIQAFTNRPRSCSIQRKQSDTQVFLTCPNSSVNGCDFFCHYIKKQNSQSSAFYKVVQENSMHNPQCDKPSLTSHTISEQGQNVSLKNSHLQPQKEFNKLLTLNDISMFKKQLEYESKGFLSKSTQFNQSKDMVMQIKLRCKNFPSNICPYEHIFSFKKVIDGCNYYQSHSINSNHIQDCQLDEIEMKEILITRKIDMSNQILEKIISQNQQIKPKAILNKLAQQLGQDNTNFLYQGLEQKNLKRSMKKYFDNAVAKLRLKIKGQQ